MSYYGAPPFMKRTVKICEKLWKAWSKSLILQKTNFAIEKNDEHLQE